MAQKEIKWSGVKRKLTQLEKSALINLIQDLFKLSAENQDFLMARFANAAASVKIYRKRILSCFYDEQGLGPLDVERAHQIIRDYNKATNNVNGTLELMLILIETATDLINQAGIHDGEFHYHLTAVLSDCMDLFDQHPSLLKQFAQRLHASLEKAQGVGWGYGEFALDMQVSLEEKSGWR